MKQRVMGLLKSVFLWGVLLLGFGQAQTCEPLAKAPPAVRLKPVAQGFNLPLYVTSPPEDDRLFVLERSGLVKIIKDQQVLPEPFLNLSSQIGLTGEMGLLSLAFHPNYAENGRVFVLFTRDHPFDTVIAEFRRDPENPDRALEPRRVILSIPQHPDSIIHRGGHLEFLGTDLYASIGDGALSAPAQDVRDFRGKVLRLEVDAVDIPLTEDQDLPVPATVFASGFRNPWRFSFDACSRSLYLADVGSTHFEELNLVTQGANYGWPYFESYTCTEAGQATDCDSTGMTFPFYAYAHISRDAQGGSGIIGGYMYRGQQLPDLQGFYVFADLKGTVWGLRSLEGQWYRWDLAQPGGGIVSLGQDAYGELYVVNMSAGVIYKLAP